MQAELLGILTAVSDWVWGPPTLILLVGTGAYLTWRLRGLQLRMLWHALYLALIVRREADDEPGDISHFQALMTALAATVGTGNIAGVATAIATGGPGALFWMWVTGLVGMATKYAEAVLAVRYRRRDANGQMCGGPMYYLSEGLGLPWLGTLFAIFTALAGFGIGNMVQSNSVAHAAQETFGIAPWASGLVMAVATAIVILGGIRSIGRAASLLVPVMIIFYLAASLVALAIFADRLVPTVGLVLAQAFTPTAASGGFAGAAVMLTIRMGVARGVFSNESGLGSAPIAAAAAKTRYPVAQAMVSMTQTFIDTIVVCTMTGLVILVSGEWDSGATGSALTAQAFSRALPGSEGGIVVAVGLILFAYTTLLGWSYYGEKAVEYLIGERAIPWYRAAWCLLIVVGAVAHLDLVWTFADVMNGLMALPNLIGLLGLSGVVVSETRTYFAGRR
ncbi:sodium:alanine symporter family protein [bacterium]|nr:sodium:alanine symporter family protein [bacterium]